MKIKDLPPPIKILAKRNVEKQFGFWKRVEYFRNGWNVHVYNAFLWTDTIEGDEYWWQVNIGNFTYEPRKEAKV